MKKVCLNNKKKNIRRKKIFSYRKFSETVSMNFDYRTGSDIISYKLCRNNPVGHPCTYICVLYICINAYGHFVMEIQRRSYQIARVLEGKKPVEVRTRTRDEKRTL